MRRPVVQLMMGALLLTTTSAFGGTIVLNNDDWPLTNAGFTDAGIADVTDYAQNVARFLTGVSSGADIWIDSDNPGLDQSDLQTALGAYTLTDTGSFSSFTLSTLEDYSAVFLSGDNLTVAELTALISYVNAGGGVYVAGGTNTITGGATGEAAQWNTFLNPFSLNLAPAFNSITLNTPTNSSSPLLNGVTQLYYENGNTVNTTGPAAQIISQTGGQGLIGIFPAMAVPEPSTALLFGFGLAGFGLYRRNRRRA